jgi:flagellar motor switch protein FliG
MSKKKPFETLRRAAPDQVLSLLRDEHPQTIAVVLSHLDPTPAASVLSALPSDIQGGVVRRIARMGRIVPEVVKDVEQLVDQKLADYAADDSGGGLNIVVAILNNTETSAERQILMSLEDEDPELEEPYVTACLSLKTFCSWITPLFKRFCAVLTTRRWRQRLRGRFLP